MVLTYLFGELCLHVVLLPHESDLSEHVPELEVELCGVDAVDDVVEAESDEFVLGIAVVGETVDATVVGLEVETLDGESHVGDELFEAAVAGDVHEDVDVAVDKFEDPVTDVGPVVVPGALVEAVDEVLLFQGLDEADDGDLTEVEVLHDAEKVEGREVDHVGFHLHTEVDGLFGEEVGSVLGHGEVAWGVVVAVGLFFAVDLELVEFLFKVGVGLDDGENVLHPLEGGDLGHHVVGHEVDGVLVAVGEVDFELGGEEELVVDEDDQLELQEGEDAWGLGGAFEEEGVEAGLVGVEEVEDDFEAVNGEEACEFPEEDEGEAPHDVCVAVLVGGVLGVLVDEVELEVIVVE